VLSGMCPVSAIEAAAGSNIGPTSPARKRLQIGYRCPP
jgi:hypothetical protein